jgi:hypothetical protein
MRWKRSTMSVGLALGLLLAWVGEAVSDDPPAPADLVKAKYEAAREAYKATVQAYQVGQSDAEKVYLWSRRLLEAQRELGNKQADQVRALEAHRGRMKDLRELAAKRYQAEQVPQADVLGAEFYAVEAALWLARPEAR